MSKLVESIVNGWYQVNSVVQPALFVGTAVLLIGEGMDRREARSAPVESQLAWERIQKSEQYQLAQVEEVPTYTTGSTD